MNVKTRNYSSRWHDILRQFLLIQKKVAISFSSFNLSARSSRGRVAFPGPAAHAIGNIPHQKFLSKVLKLVSYAARATQTFRLTGHTRLF